MSGPFVVDTYAGDPAIRDDRGELVCYFDEGGREKAERVCAALNAAHYLAKATGSAK